MNSMLTCLTGIKPTGTPHWGNYFSAILPALNYQNKYNCHFFIADYHALNAVKDPERIRKEVFEVAATWLAAGLNPNKAVFYRQSTIRAIGELTVILMCYTAKGLMNRAHAYKSMVESNVKNNADPDRHVNMGLFNYPVMMAADILMFQANLVPIGKDQLQHLEIANDIAEAFHAQTGNHFFQLPKPLTSDAHAVLVGTDGRKMSKSYQNTIPLFAEDGVLRKQIMKIPTTSQTIEEPKNPNTCNVYSLYRLFATEEEKKEMQHRYRAGGLGWGEAKNALFEVCKRAIAPMRERYLAFVADKASLLKTLQEGEAKANAIADKNIREIKRIVGLTANPLR